MLDIKALLTKTLDAIKTLKADSGWKTIGSNGVQYRIYRGVCYVVIEGATVSANTLTVLATLPVEARPDVVINPYCHSNYIVGQCWITTAGVINCRFQSASSTVAGFVAFPV